MNKGDKFLESLGEFSYQDAVVGETYVHIEVGPNTVQSVEIIHVLELQIRGDYKNSLYIKYDGGYIQSTHTHTTDAVLMDIAYTHDRCKATTLTDIIESYDEEELFLMKLKGYSNHTIIAKWIKEQDIM